MVDQFNSISALFSSRMNSFANRQRVMRECQAENSFNNFPMDVARYTLINWSTKAIACSVALWLWVTAALAQETPKVASEPEDAKTQAVSVEDVSQQAVRTASLLETLVPSKESYAALGELAAKTDRLLKDVDERLTSIRFALAATPKVSSMQEWEAELIGLLAPLESLDKDLDQRLAILRKALEQVDANTKQWQAIHEEAVRVEASAEVQKRIDSTLATLDKTRRQISGQRDTMLSLRDRLVDPIGNVNRTLKQLRTDIQERLAGIFNRDRPVLWKADLYETIRAELRAGGSESVIQQVLDFKDYVRGNIPKIGFHIVLFIGLAVGLRLLGSRAIELAEEDYDLRRASLVFELPTAMALIIALALTSTLHPTAPVLFIKFAYTVLAIPAVMIVSRILSTANRPVVWALLFVFLVDRMRDFLATVPTLERAIFLLELVGALVFLLWLMRPKRIAEIPLEARQHPLFRMVRRLTGAAIALFTIAILAEVVGLGDLADIIGSGTLRSAYFALFIYALVVVLQSLVTYALILRPLSLLKMVSAHRQVAHQRIERVLRVLGFALWAYLTLASFGLEASLKASVGGVLGAQLTVGTLAVSLGDVLVLVVTIWLTFALARLIDFVLTEDVYSRVSLPRGVPYAISTLTRYTLIVLGFLVAMAAAGIELTKLTIVAGGLSVGIGFGLQNIINNFVSGLILLFERPLKVGDDIEIASGKGEIRRIGIRASTIRTGDGAEVIVPNSKLISEAVTNRTFADRRRRIEIKVSVKSEFNAQQVIELLLAVANAHSSVLQTPPPRAYLVQYAESSLEFVLRVWIAEFRDETATRSDLNAALQKTLAEAGIVEPLRSIEPNITAESKAQS